MTIFEILAIAVGLAMDAFAVSITSGLALKKAKVNDALRMGLSRLIFAKKVEILR